MDRTISKTRAVFRWLPGCLALGTIVSCAVSTQQEVQLGANTAAQIDTMLPLIHDASVQNYINSLGNQLAKVTDTRNLAWHFTVVDSKEVNAFALPGGWVYVNRGLIERAQNMSQVAGVLGHEIGHVTLRHTVQQMQQSQGANTGVALLCTLTKVCESGAGQAAINLGGSALFAKFSRTDEAEADAEGVKTTVKAAIDPGGFKRCSGSSSTSERPTRPRWMHSSRPIRSRRIASPQRRRRSRPIRRVKSRS